MSSSTGQDVDLPATDAPRQRRVGLKDIARSMGVSVATASMALADHPDINGETKRRVRALSREMGYRKPARRAAGQHRKTKADTTATHRFGFVLLGSRLDNEAHLGTLHTFVVRASDFCRGLEVQAIEEVSDTQRAVDQLLAFVRGLDGVILNGKISHQMIDELELLGVPYVVVGRSMAQLGHPDTRLGRAVRPDVQTMSETATHALLAAGHERIGFVAEETPAGLWSAEWLRGYRIAMLEALITPRDAWVHIAGQLDIGGEPAARTMTALDDAQRPTAFVIPDVRTAASFLQHLKRLGDIELPPEAVVISGVASLLPRYGMERHPYIDFSLEALATVALRELHHSCESPLPCSTDVILPFQIHNLPGA